MHEGWMKKKEHPDETKHFNKKKTPTNNKNLDKIKNL